MSLSSTQIPNILLGSFSLNIHTKTNAHKQSSNKHKDKTGNVHNVTLRHVRATTVAAENQ
jgi:hypothetical protein